MTALTILFILVAVLSEIAIICMCIFVWQFMREMGDIGDICGGVAVIALSLAIGCLIPIAFLAGNLA